MDNFEAAVNGTLAAHRLLTPGARVVVAVSGGADSVALLHALAALRPAWKLKLFIAHLDHALRPDSGDDAEFVKHLGRRLEIETSIERHDVGERCAREGWSLEDGARPAPHPIPLAPGRAPTAPAPRRPPHPRPPLPAHPHPARAAAIACARLQPEHQGRLGPAGGTEPDRLRLPRRGSRPLLETNGQVGQRRRPNTGHLRRGLPAATSGASAPAHAARHSTGERRARPAGISPLA